jgi:carboxymethylenebutenolidase
MAAADPAAAMAHMHEHDLPLPSPQALQRPPAGTVDAQAVVYGRMGEHELRGWLARPAGASDKLPGVLMFHEWWGLNDNIRSMAEQLAAQGYVVLAMDMYGGRVGTTPDEAQALMKEATADAPRLDRNILLGHEYLKNSAHATKTATLGWCFGGSMSFEAAQLLSDKSDATVIYYGFVNDDAAALDKLKAPVLGLFGGQDQGIPVATVEAFRKGLEARGAHPLITVYPAAGHAFANPSGRNYRKDDAEDAWQRTLAFLGEHLKH